MCGLIIALVVVLIAVGLAFVPAPGLSLAGPPRPALPAPPPPRQLTLAAPVLTSANNWRRVFALSYLAFSVLVTAYLLRPGWFAYVATLAPRCTTSALAYFPLASLSACFPAAFAALLGVCRRLGWVSPMQTSMRSLNLLRHCLPILTMAALAWSTAP